MQCRNIIFAAFQTPSKRGRTPNSKVETSISFAYASDFNAVEKSGRDPNAGPFELRIESRKVRLLLHHFSQLYHISIADE